MIDKDLLRLLGGNKKYIGFCVGWMVLGLFANVASLRLCASPLHLLSSITAAARVFFWYQ